MRFAYTIWNKKHFDEIDALISTTKDVVDYYIVVLWPGLERDNLPAFIENGIDKSYIGDWCTKDRITEVLDKCKSTGKEIVVQLIPTQHDSRGKEPNWWQGYISFDTETKWQTFFSDFRQVLRDAIVFTKDYADRYLIGAELTSTLYRKKDWQTLLNIAKMTTAKPIGYSHHFSLPLKYYYRWMLRFLVTFGKIFYGDEVYSQILERLLSGQFEIPEPQLIEVGKNLYEAPNINTADMDFIKLNDYWWYVMDKQYSSEELRKRWEKAEGINFMPSVRNWITQYAKDKELWIENDLNIGFMNCTDTYYKLWWEVFLDKHKDIADAIVVWDNGDYKRWADAVRR